MLNINRYVLTTLTSSSSASVPCGQVLRMVGEPVVGQRLTFFGTDGFRVITTTVTKVEPDDLGLGTYIHTQNSLYHLERLGASQMAA
jgi:hypothetical protein